MILFATAHDVSVASHSERRSLLSFSQLLSLTIEVLMLWKILCEHQFHIIASFLSIQSRSSLAATSLCNIILSGQQVKLLVCTIRMV